MSCKTAGHTVLVIDDEQPNLDLLADILQTEGYDVRLADSGQAGLDDAAGAPPDLVLLDVRMAEMDGYEACRRLKGDPELADIPVIFVSALGDTGDKVRGFEAGGVDYITRPFSPEEVLARVKTHVVLSKLQKQASLDAENRRAAEEDRRMRQFFDSSADSIFIHDLEGRMLEVNDTACERLGYSRDELLRMTPVDFNSPEFAARMPERIAELRDKGYARFETAHVTSDGRTIPIELCSRIMEFQGKPTVLSMARDIVERKKAEHALRMTQHSVDYSNVATFWVDSNGRLSYVNDAACRELGYSRKELLQMSVPDICPSWTPEDIPVRLRAIKEAGTAAFEALHQRSDGSTYPVEVTASCLQFEGEEYFFAFATDISERKRAEEELREHQDLLEKAVTQRTMELEREISERRKVEESLRRSKESLQRQHDVLGDLATSSALVHPQLDTAFPEITEVASRGLLVQRASIWLYIEDKSAMRCFDLYELSGDQHSQGMELAAKDFPSYFEAIADGEPLAVRDAGSDPRTSEFRESYLEPNCIEAMLDMAIWVRGEMVGIVCHEHMGPPRTWTIEEESFARSIADFVSLVMEANHRRRAEEDLLKRAAELEQFNKSMVGREMRVIELKEEVNRVCTELGRPLKYPPVWQESYGTPGAPELDPGEARAEE